MRIGVDAETAAELKPVAQPAPIEIEPPWVAVDFDRDPVLGAGSQHPLDIEIVTRAAQQLPAGHMADYGHERIGSRPDQALGLHLPIEPELAVDAADDEIRSEERRGGK